MLHELIDREDPRCLYCHSECDIHIDGVSFVTPSIDVDILTCRECGEKFEIRQLGLEPSQVISFLFSCKDIVVSHFYEKGFIIADKSLLWENLGRLGPLHEKNFISPFEVDFSDKNKLHKKLKTYLVFS